MRKLIVVGNPPYQINDGGGKGSSAKPIYHLFVESIIDNICPDYFSFIIPSRWMVGGMGLNDHRERMMNDKRMKKIVHFEGERSVFETVQLAGGVNYFLWVKQHKGNCEFVNGNTTIERNLNDYDIILQDNNAFGILQKITKKSNIFINSVCYSNKPFGIATNYANWSEYGIPCYTVRKEIKYIDGSNINDKYGIMNKWKVCTPKGAGGHQLVDSNGFKTIIKNIFIIEPNAICTETYIVVNVFDTKKEAEHFISYMKTKFFRFMLGLRVLTQDINKEKFAWVPDVEDYSAPWTDQELYKKFGLTRQEIAYIESKIKAL